ncbi:MAG TPA: lipid II flippase MurJ [Sporichthyaceae bacterium]|nr:lipid II flippase MurJ [Sporichthyaceae bacterium]
MTDGPRVALTTPRTDGQSVPEPAASGLRRGSLAGAVLLVAAVTVLARAVGFGRWVVFAHTVHSGCLADVYNTANLLPNVLFEVVAGGALAGAVVPVLAPAVARGDRATVDRLVSALLTWSLALLVPVSVIAAAAARPLIGAFLGAGHCPAAAPDVGTRMLLVFLPQLFCYAVAVVLSGAAQAHRRFLAAALAPLVSSTVVIGAYLLFARLAHGDTGVDTVPRSARAALAVGTTLGVLALAATVTIPIRATGLRLRPRWTFPSGTARQVRGLAAAGVAALLAQQGALLVVIWLANHNGTPGSVTVYTWAGAVFLLPYAALAVPLATAAFPRIAAATAAGDRAAVARLTAAGARGVMAAGCLGAAVLVAVAAPVSRLFAAGGSALDTARVADGITAIAPGLAGYALAAHLSRVLYAAHRGRRAAVATVAGWVAVAAIDLTAVPALPGRRTVTVLAIGSTIGFTLSGLLLLLAVRRLHGPAALAGLARTGPVTLVAAVLLGEAGRQLGEHLGTTNASGSAVAAAVVGGAVVVGYVGLVGLADRRCLSGLEVPALRRPRLLPRSL